MVFYLIISLLLIATSSFLTIFLGFMASVTLIATNVTPFTKLMTFGIWIGLLGSVTLLIMSIAMLLSCFWNDLAMMQGRFQNILRFVFYPSIGVVLCIILWGFLIGEGIHVLKIIFFMNS
jgi:hypothetical protein